MPKGIYKHTKEMYESRRGKTHTEETKKKISSTLKGRYMEKNNSMWKGDKVGNSSLHEWIRNNKPKAKFCEECKKEKKLSLANIKNHNYTRNLNDYKWLCYSCHKKMDIKRQVVKG